MAAPALSPDLVERFRGDLAALLRRALRPGEHFAVAVSGGPDSLALLLLASAALPGRIHAVTVDHSLRPESAEEAAHVALICSRLGVPVQLLKVSVPQAGGNLQRLAREARYDAIADWIEEAGLCWLMTAHHLDDQAETLIMRLLRGAGVRGLAAVPPRGRWPTGGSQATVLRPLLAWRRSELAAVVSAAGIDAVDDPSNRDDRFERVRIRRQLAKAPWIDPESLGRSAAALREADEALDWAVRQLWDRQVAVRGDTIEYQASEMPAEIVRRLLLAILKASGARTEPRSEELTRLAETLRNGGTATLGGIKCRGGAVWCFAPAPPRRPVRGSR